MISLTRKKGDLLAVALAIILVLAMLIALFAYAGSGDNVVTIKYDGLVVHKMNLARDEVYTMKKEDYPLLQGDLTVVIENGKVRVDEQTSRYNYCELIGETSNKGTAIVCAPNHVIISIEGFDENATDWPPRGQKK
ncbi:hypothetical protein GX831_02205 [bacterium]|jgi:hypothetical protein|nr:hypothetical protein [bacterium]